MWFGCYSLGTISYSMLTFRECPEDAASLLREIKEARDELSAKGISID
jgi:dolichyl-phosphate mannosyltransferase polypeptide 3